jgi:hypothetical protein
MKNTRRRRKAISADSKQYQAGGSVSLTWRTNATDISIDGVGAVQANGSQIRQQTSSPEWNLESRLIREEKRR